MQKMNLTARIYERSFCNLRHFELSLPYEKKQAY